MRPPRAAVLAGALLATLAATRAEAAKVEGTVRDRAGHGVEYANIAVPALKAGTVSDTGGAFTLDLPPGRVTLEVTQLGFQTAKLEVTVADGLLPLRVVLVEQPVPVAEVVVAASTFGKTGTSEGATLRRLDIVTTPGGAADVFQALRALPSINAPDEGAALYVRGGEPGETLIRIDDGPIGHPYHYEGASGGLFSAFDAYMLKDAFFSSGGFSSKYGGALSGVLDIETQDPMNLKTVSVGANLAGAGVSSSWALVPDRLSFVGTMRVSDVHVLERLYGSAREYVSAPRSGDGAGRLLWRHSATGRIALLFLGSADRAGVIFPRLNYEGEYAQHSSNKLFAVQFQQGVGRTLALKGQVSAQRFATDWSYGATTQDEVERHVQGNLDAVWAASDRHELSFGASAGRLRDQITGFFPVDSTDLAPGAPLREKQTDAAYSDPGFYLEDKFRVWGPVYATLGGRADYASLPDVWTVDPRGALAWRIDGHQTARIAAGRYHQPVDARYLDPVYGNPLLPPLEATHLIAGYEWKTSDLNVRLETYRKEYRNLIVPSATSYYAGDGHGYARGVDFLLQGRHGGLSGWISYGYLDSRRKEGDAPREVASSYGVAHSLTLVTAYQLPSQWQVGGRLGLSTGRPYTPIVGATFDSARAVWHPVEAERNSGTMPHYSRLDIRLTRLFSLPATGGLPASSLCAFYIEGMNVLGTRNVLDYVYSEDYSVRRTTDSYFSRAMAVVGFALTW